MNQEFKFNKAGLSIIVFLFIFGIALMVFRSDFLLQYGIGNAVEAEVENELPPAEGGEKFNLEQDIFLVVYDPDRSESTAVKDNIVKVLEYLKKEHEVISVSEMPEDLSAYHNLIIAFAALGKMDDFPSVLDYTAAGGHLFFAVRPELDGVYFSNYSKLGVETAFRSYHNTTGIKLASELLLGEKGLEIEDRFISNSSLSVELKDSVDLHALSAEDVPLLWSVPDRKGKIMVLNGTMLESKMNRGIIAGALSYLNEDFIYPVLNSKVMYIDDFPAPFPEGNHEAVYRDYRLSTPDFFQKIWWPDMLEVAEKNDMVYTAVLIETYQGNVNGPFNDRLVEENLKIYGRELIKSGGELGVHGYNHQSLTTDQNQVEKLEYTAWEEQAAMAESLAEVRQLVEELFPDYTLKTYVPPSNVLAEEGKQAIREALPSVENIASLYVPDTEVESYIQEIETGAGFNELPRFTSDYTYDDDMKWMIANAATLHGAFSHFVHPDDVLDEERSGSRNWKQLLERFDQLTSDVKENYPWMKSQTASESAASLQHYQQAEVFVKQNDKSIEIYINNFSEELDFLLRSDKKVTGVTGAEAEKAGEDHYFIHVTSAESVIELEGVSG